MSSSTIALVKVIRPIHGIAKSNSWSGESFTDVYLSYGHEPLPTTLRACTNTP